MLGAVQHNCVDFIIAVQITIYNIVEISLKKIHRSGEMFTDSSQKVVGSFARAKVHKSMKI